ncbi:MAG: ferrous iron transport protein A [Chloroflexi bacterium]|nr:ferrous iron transport protein A [Chloroflexota bacterium]
MTLDQLQPGQIATVTAIGGDGPLRRRILDMGLTTGVLIEMIKTSPFGDPLEYKVRDYHISLRRDEAQLIEVEMS